MVVLRLALPSTIASPMSLFNLLTLRMTVGASAGERTPGAPGLEGAQRAAVLEMSRAENRQAILAPTWWRARSASLPWWAGLWAAGVLGLGGFVVVTHCRLARRIGRERQSTDAGVIGTSGPLTPVRPAPSWSWKVMVHPGERSPS